MHRAILTKQQAYSFREALGLVTHKYVKHKVNWYRYPNVGCVLSTEILYHSKDLPHDSPVISSLVSLSLVPSLDRSEFDRISKSFYCIATSDKGALSAFRHISAIHQLVVVFCQDHPLENFTNEYRRASRTLWNSGDVGHIDKGEIQMIYDSINELYCIEFKKQTSSEPMLN